MDISRRSFLKAALAAGAVTSFPGIAAFAKGDKVRLACVGIGQQAWNDIQEFEKTGLAQIVALCDTDLDGGQCAAALKRYPDAPRFTDFRKMLDAMDGKIDAVAVMTPDHSHFPALMAAMKRGLAVFCEKPLAHTFEECELLMAAEKKYGVVTQMGNQGHSGENYHQFKHYVETGVIDVSKLTKLVAHMNNPRRWHKWNGKVSSFPAAQEMPKGLDWDSWLATASFHDYSKDFDQGEWRSWYDFGNGCLGDWGAHTMDTMHRFFNLGLPTEVQIRDVQGWNAYVFPMQDTLTFRFPAAGKRPAIDLDWYEGVKNKPALPEGYRPQGWNPDIPAAKGSTAADAAKNLVPGKFFYLSDGTAWQGGSHGSPLMQCGSDVKAPSFPRPGSNHYANFLLAVLGREETRSPFSVAAPLSQVFCLGCIAQRLNRSFRFDPASKTIVGDEEANALLKGSKGTPRKGWEEFYRV
ncbi:MAG: gfo/Idh/MocA family oxidoreductase [Lentisphaerae bacterium]|nr:gfo/Idh/MocA family oxidoreductase [Lentisphaerota bacterium]